MRSYGSARRIVVVAAIAGSLGRQGFAASDPLDRYRDVRAREQQVYASPGPTVEEFRSVMAGYQDIVRRYPTSGYADNALWQAAGLASEAYRRFGDERDVRSAVRLLTWLASQYPASSLVPKATAEINRLTASAPMPPSEAGTRPASDRPLEASHGIATIRAIQRARLREVVRVTLELDAEVPYYQERLAGPDRVFFDLKGTRAAPSLRDATFRYFDDVVRDIRVGRHPNNTTRVVIDLEEVIRYSVFTLYNPYRIVIDCERAQPPAPPAAQRAGAAAVADPDPPAQPAAPAPSPESPAAGTAHELISASPIAAATRQAPAMPSANTRGGFSLARQLGLGISRIVIDAGHGGHDPGASAFGLSEAELVLDVSWRLENLLVKQPGVEVILTRSSNAYVPLEERTAIANREAADLFLSIHANASANTQAHGVETYFLNFALNPEAEAVAARENAGSGRTMNSLSDIVKVIALKSKIDESRDFASLMQRALVQRLRSANKNLKDLGVKHAPFVVLIGAAMPSVLAEISFVTNRQEARLLKSSAYRQRIAEALGNGILRYRQTLKKVARVAQQ